MSYYIEFKEVSKTFKTETVLNKVSFELEKGKIYGFVGRNGSGKTVIFKLISGLMRPNSGEIFVQNKNMTHAKEFPKGIGVLLETPGFIPHYSGIKNLKILNGLSKNPASIETLKNSMLLVGLDPSNKKPVRTYSMGMKQKLGIAQAVMNSPELLILDEPMNGLDEESVRKMRHFFTKLKEEQQVTILLASHNKEDIQYLCDDLFKVSEGSVTGSTRVQSEVAI